MHDLDLSFDITHRLELPGAPSRGRVGVLRTPHGRIDTPAFIPVGTAAAVKALTPDQVRSTGAQAVLANAYHLYLRPGPEIVDQAGGVRSFMAWGGPTYTDSGGFQVMSLGSGMKKVVEMDAATAQPVQVRKKERLAVVDEDGVTFRSHLDGSSHRFTPERSIAIQHHLGADIIFAFDELTTLGDSYDYQRHSVERTRLWAERCLAEHDRQTVARSNKPRQSLWGVIQGAHYEDLRRSAVRGLLDLSEQAHDAGRRGFGGFGIGGALEKSMLGTIVGWCVDELPAHLPRHLLGISEPNDVFEAVENGADTFDCVAPTRIGRHGIVLTAKGPIRIANARYRNDFSPLVPDSDQDESRTFTKAYVHHLFRAKEQLAGTLCSLQNIRFMIDLMADIRVHIAEGTYAGFKEAWLARYYG